MAFCALPWDWDWRWVPLETSHPLSCAVEGYLVLDRHFRPARRAVPTLPLVADDAGLLSTSMVEADDDAAALRDDAPQATIEWEFHVLLSTAYGAPELRLRATWVDGAPLSLDQVRAELSSEVVISREEHPVTGESFVLFHGCCGEDRVDAHGDASLLVWFAGIAATIGLRIPPEQWHRLRETSFRAAPAD